MKIAAIGLVAFWLWISLSLLVRMWLVHRRVAWGKKVIWSGILMIPCFGWLADGACFQPLGTNKHGCPLENNLSNATLQGNDGSGGDGGSPS